MEVTQVGAPSPTIKPRGCHAAQRVLAPPSSLSLSPGLQSQGAEDTGSKYSPDVFRLFKAKRCPSSRFRNTKQKLYSYRQLKALGIHIVALFYSSNNLKDARAVTV